MSKKKRKRTLEICRRCRFHDSNEDQEKGDHWCDWDYSAGKAMWTSREYFITKEVHKSCPFLMEQLVLNQSFAKMNENEKADSKSQ